jgi:hypothetical protein
MAKYTIAVGSEKFRPEQQEGQQWEAALAAQYRLNSSAYCECIGRGTKRLAIRFYRSGNYGIAKFPHSGEEHATSCDFYAESPEKSGRKCYGSVLKEAADGTLRINMALGLRKSESPIPPHIPRCASGTGESNPRITLLGLLHLLWQEAGLNKWWPAMAGKRSLGLVTYRLRRSASNIRCGNSHLDDHVLIGAYSREGEASVVDRFDFAGRNKLRLLTPLVLPRWSSEVESRFEDGLFSGRPFYGLPRLNIEPALWSSSVRRFPGVMHHWRNGGIVVGLLQLEPVRPGHSLIASVALMALNAHWIPVESAFELQVADALVAENRGFIKPLRFDASVDEVFPDFVLLDARDGRQIPMEVFGMQTESYLARKAEKCDYYNRIFGVDRWWCWNASSDPMPSIPQR